MTTKLFLGSVQIHSKLLSRGFFHIFWKNFNNRFFWRELLFFQTLPQIQFSSEIDWLAFHAKIDNSLSLIKNILFYLSCDLTFFFERTPLDVSDAFTMYLDVIWWINKFKTIWNCKLHQNIRNFWRHFEYLMIFPEGWDYCRVDFLKLEFSILILWQPNFFWEMFKYIQNFCHGDFFISLVKFSENQKIDFFLKKVAIFSNSASDLAFK